MRKQGAIVLGSGGANLSDGEGAMVENAVQANVVAAGHRRRVASGGMIAAGRHAGIVRSW